MTTNQELIGAGKVAEILKISIHSLRDYKKRGLIIVTAKRGNTDLYDKSDIVRRADIIREKRAQGFSLAQIRQILAIEQVNVINLPGYIEFTSEMGDEERLRGFLTEVYQKAPSKTKAYLDELSRKWNIFFRTKS